MNPGKATALLFSLFITFGGGASNATITGNNLKLGTVTTSYSEAFGNKKHHRT